MTAAAASGTVSSAEASARIRSSKRVGFFGRTFGLLKQTIGEFSDDKAPTFAASLAYYTVFSLAPILLIVLSIAGFVFGEEAARGELFGQLRSIVGVNGAKTIEAAMASASKAGAGVFATVVAAVVLLFGATGVFAELQNALNTIWKVPPAKTSGIRAFLKTRLLSAAVVFGIGFLLLVSLVVSAGLAGLGTWMGSWMPAWELVGSAVNFVIGLGVITLLFALMFKLLPDTQVAWRDVWLGAAVSSGLFSIGKLAIAVYLAKTAVESSYGAAGSLAALLVWVYWSSMITLLGASLASVVARRRNPRPIEEAKLVERQPG